MSKDASRERPTSQHPVRDKVEEFGPTVSMMFIIAVIAVVIFVVLDPRDPNTIVIGSDGHPTELFDATTALAYAERLSRIAEITIGGAITLALGLVGFSWLSTSNRIERDRQDLADHKADLDEQMNRQMREHVGDFNTKLTNVSASLGAEISRNRREVDEKIDSVVQSQSVGHRDLYMLLRNFQRKSSEVERFDRLLESSDYNAAFEAFVGIVNITRNELVHMSTFLFRPIDENKSQSFGLPSPTELMDLNLPPSVLKRTIEFVGKVNDQVIRKHSIWVLSDIDTLLAILGSDPNDATAASLFAPMLREIRRTIDERAHDE